METTSEPEEPVRIGVYLCRCGVNIGSYIDMDALKEFSQTLPHVVVVKTNNFTCSDPGQDVIKNDIQELGINRVVVAA